MQTPGEILKQQRKILGKTIFEVSQETKILEKHIKLIEANDFEKFDSPVFARGFTKIYAQFLGLDENRILALFRRENKELDIKQPKKTKKINIKSLITTTNIVVMFVGIFFIFLTIYLIFLYIKFQKEPTYTIYTPINGYQTEIKNLNIEGIVDRGTNLYINDTPISPTGEKFKHEISLVDGENIIHIKGENRINKKKIKETYLNIKYVGNKKEEVKNETEIVEYKVKLSVKNASTWVKLIIDDNQIYAQVLKSGFTKTFNMKKNIEFVSGIRDNTILQINNETKLLKVNTQTGITSINCQLVNNLLNCNTNE